MTAVSIFPRGDVGYVLSDGALWAPDGRILGFRPKTHILPHLNAVVVTRGPARFGEYLASIIPEEFGTFEALVSGLAGFVQHQHQQHSIDRDIEVWLCGWSGQRKAVEAYGLCSAGMDRDEYRISAEPWEMVRVGHDLCLPGGNQFWAGLAASNAQNMEELCVAVAEAQRGTVCQAEGRTFGSIVGGFMQQTIVTEAGISTKIIKCWDDKIGEPARNN